MDLYLLTTPDYSAVVGYAERVERDPLDFAMRDASRVTGYDTDQHRLFTRKGLTNAERRTHALRMRLVTATYFGISSMRPEHMSAPAYSRLRAQERAERGGAA